MKKYLREYFYILGDKRIKLALIVTLFILSSLLELIGIGLIGPFMGAIISPDDSSGFGPFVMLKNYFSYDTKDFILVLGGGIIGVFYIKGFSAYWVHKSIVRFSFEHQAFIISKLMKAYQNMPYEMHLLRNSSSIINVISGHVRFYTEMTLMASLKLASECIIFLSIIILLAITNFWATSMLGVLILIIFLAYDALVKKPFHNAGRETAISSENVIKGVNEGIGGLKEITILGKKNYFHRKVKQAAYRYAEYAAKAQAMQNIPRYMLESAVISFVITFAIYSLYTKGNVASAMSVIGMFAVAAVRLMPSAYQMSVTFTNLRFSKHHMGELYQDLKDLDKYDGARETNKDKDNVEQRRFEKLTFQNVNYRYPESGTDTLEGLELEILKGDCIGIIGKSGSGKTTLIDIILGLLTPQKGKVSLNDMPLNESINSWYEMVAYIPQDIYLTDDSLKRNIALGIDDKNIDDEKINQAISMAQLTQVVGGLDDGVDTVLGENGVKLSGGQKQRVALARAIYHEREVIIMDEATSALDSETEKQVVTEINSLKGKKTLIIIAHRLSTVKNCNRIVTIANGKIVQEKLN